MSKNETCLLMQCPSQSEFDQSTLQVEYACVSAWCIWSSKVHWISSINCSCYPASTTVSLGQIPNHYSFWYFTLQPHIWFRPLKKANENLCNMWISIVPVKFHCIQTRIYSSASMGIHLTNVVIVHINWWSANRKMCVSSIFTPLASIELFFW